MMPPEDSLKSEGVRAAVELAKTGYDDALKPFAQELGKSFGTLGRLVNVAHGPLRILVWGGETIGDFIAEKVGRKLEERGVPADRIIIPDPDVAVPAIEALRYNKLKEEFTNLLATAMDGRTAHLAHPAFAEIIKQLTGDEAKILKALHSGGSVAIADFRYGSGVVGYETLYRLASNLASDCGFNSEAGIPRAIDNPCRLGLAEIPPLQSLNSDIPYIAIEQSRLADFWRAQRPNNQAAMEFSVERKVLEMTTLGRLFFSACIDNSGPSLEADALSSAEPDGAVGPIPL